MSSLTKFLKRFCAAHEGTFPDCFASVSDVDHSVRRAPSDRKPSMGPQTLLYYLETSMCMYVCMRFMFDRKPKQSSVLWLKFLLKDTTHTHMRTHIYIYHIKWRCSSILSHTGSSVFVPHFLSVAPWPPSLSPFLSHALTHTHTRGSFTVICFHINIMCVG